MKSYIDTVTGVTVKVCRSQKVVYSKMHVGRGVCRHPLPLERQRRKDGDWMPESNGVTFVTRKGGSK